MSYASAFWRILETGKPLVVLVGADWCPACRTMKTAIIPQLRRSGGLDDVLFAIVDTDRESRNSSKIMSGGSIPQPVMYTKTADGWKREQLTGAHSVAAVQSFVDRGVAATAQLAKSDGKKETVQK